MPKKLKRGNIVYYTNTKSYFIVDDDLRLINLNGSEIGESLTTVNNKTFCLVANSIEELCNKLPKIPIVDPEAGQIWENFVEGIIVKSEDDYYSFASFDGFFSDLYEDIDSLIEHESLKFIRESL